MDNSACEHREIIDEYAAKGWRYVGYLPTMFSGEGGTKEVDLTQSLAKFAFSMFWRAMRFAEEQQVPILLDY